MIFKPNCYLAFKISPLSQGALLSAFPPKYSRVLCHHITVEFNIKSQAVLDGIIAAIGEHPIFEAVGYSDDGSLECFSVEVHDPIGNRPTKVRPDRKVYHITHSLEQNRKPVESNHMLALSNGEPQVTFAPIKLKGELKLIPK